MAEIAEDVVPQTTTTVPAPKPSEGSGETVTVPKKDWEDTQHKAEVSGQNFERLKKANERTAELERELAALQDNPVPSDIDANKITKLEGDIADLKAVDTKRQVIESFPQLKDLWTDLESFREDPENAGMSLKTAAKAFLTEKGLLGDSKPRAGFEPPTGGDRQPQSQGMTVAEAENLRKNDYKKYREMLKSGKLKVNYSS